MILRCQACAAPLRRTAFVVTCPHCGAENQIGAHPDAAEQAARMVVAAEEARAATAVAQSEGERHLAQYEALVPKALAGDKDAAQRAVQSMEAYIRAQYIPTMKMVDAMDPESDDRIQTLEQIEQVVEDVCRSTAESLGIGYTSQS